MWTFHFVRAVAESAGIRGRGGSSRGFRARCFLPVLCAAVLLTGGASRAALPQAALRASGAGTDSGLSIQGKVPLLVHFDATGSTDADTKKPIHHLTYCFDAGDGNTADYTLAGHKRVRKAKWCGGPQFAYVYETPGNYAARVTVYDGDGNTDTATVTISAEAFAGARTVCVADDVNGSFADCPSGATRKTEGNPGYESLDRAIATGCAGFDQVLFQGGGSFATNSSADVTCESVGVYGRSNGRAVVTGTGMSEVFRIRGDDRRVWSFEYTGSGAENVWTADKGVKGDSDFVLIRDLRIRNVNRVMDMSHSVQGIGSVYTNPFVVGLFENDIENFGKTAGVTVMIGARRLAIVGNRFVDSGDKKILRTNHVGKDNNGRGGGFITANKFADCGGACMTLRGADTSGFAEGCPDCWSENMVVADNWIVFTGNDKVNLCGKNKSEAIVKMRDYIFERNYSTLGNLQEAVSRMHKCNSENKVDYTWRNNIVDARGANLNARIFDGVGEGSGSHGHEIYNNAVLGDKSGQAFWDTAKGTDCVFRNNVYWNTSGGGRFFGTACPTQSNNWDPDGVAKGADSGINALSGCPFTTCDPRDGRPEDFELRADAKTLLDAGVRVPVLTDYWQRLRPAGSGWDVGAGELSAKSILTGEESLPSPFLY